MDKALAIDEIKKFIAEQDLKSDDRYIAEPIRRRPIDKDYEEKVAIIGAGPAGMSCAYYLARMGYVNVTVFDRNKEPGGMLVMGIPSYRLDRSALRGEIEVLEKMGVKFQMNTEIGKDITIQQLREPTWARSRRSARSVLSSAAATWPWTYAVRQSVWAQRPTWYTAEAKKRCRRTRKKWQRLWKRV